MALQEIVNSLKAKRRPRLWHDITTRFLMTENCLRQPNFQIGGSPKRIVVISTDRIGDAFNCIYFLANLSVLYPNAEIVFIGKQFGDAAFVEQIIGQFAHRTLLAECLTEEVFKELKADVVFDLNPVGFLFPFCRVPYPRIGHHQDCDLVVPLREFNFKANDHLNILRSLGKTIQFRYPPIRLPQLNDEGLALGHISGSYVAVCLEATAAARMMPDAVAGGLIEFLLRSTDSDIYILGNDINGLGFAYLGHSSRVHNMTGKLSLFQSICIINHSKFVVSVDTGLMHAASYLGIPLLAVFTCGNPARSGPQGQLGRTVVVRVLMDSAIGRWVKDDNKHSGIERQYLRLDHVIDGLESLHTEEPTTLGARVITTEDVISRWK